jgi:hypothetical protein
LKLGGVGKLDDYVRKKGVFGNNNRSRATISLG